MAVELRGLRIDSFQCRNHAEREGVGICVSCRRVFCVECSTKIDGVNHCRECLAKRGATAEARESGRGGVSRVFGGLFAVLLIAVSIAVFAGTLVLYGDSRAHGSAGRVANRDRMDSIVSGLRQYKRDTGSFPAEDEEAPLRSLVVEPQGVTGWKGPYVDQTPGAVSHGVRDGYETPIHYWLAPDGKTCAIGSSGADRIFESKLKDATPMKIGDGTEAEAEGDDTVLVVD
jgi:hypothetical protein